MYSKSQMIGETGEYLYVPCYVISSRKAINIKSKYAIYHEVPRYANTPRCREGAKWLANQMAGKQETGGG